MLICQQISALYPHIVTKFVMSDCNTGVVRNCRRGLGASEGEWIKFIAADDIMEHDAIARLISSSTDVDVVVSRFRAFGLRDDVYPDGWTVRALKGRHLARSVLMGFGNVAPGAMFRAEALRKEGLPSEDYVMLEDLPTFLTLADKGYRFGYLDEVTVRYRTHEEQVTFIKSTARTAFDLDMERFLKSVVTPRLGRFHPFLLHRVYQNWIDEVCRDWPRLPKTVARMIDPIRLWRRIVNGY